MADGELTIYVGVKNGGKADMDLLLEPWAEDYVIRPGAEFVIEGRGPGLGAGFWVEHGPKEITVHSWPGSIIRVLQDGKEVGGPIKRPPAPDFSG